MGDHVQRFIPAQLQVPDGPLVAMTLIYDRERPWEVTARFPTVSWVFARDLLAAGLHAPAGLGDVHVTPATATDVRLVLDNGTDPALVLLLPLTAVARFLAATAHVVAFGDEPAHTDLDAITDALRRAA